MRVTPLTRETRNAKTLANVGISAETALVRRRQGSSTLVIQLQQRGSVSQVESRNRFARECVVNASGGQGEALGLRVSGTHSRVRQGSRNPCSSGLVTRTHESDESDDWHCARRMTDAGGWLLRGRAAGVSWMKAWWINELSWE